MWGLNIIIVFHFLMIYFEFYLLKINFNHSRIYRKLIEFKNQAKNYNILIYNNIVVVVLRLRAIDLIHINLHINNFI